MTTRTRSALDAADPEVVNRLAYAWMGLAVFAALNFGFVFTTGKLNLTAAFFPFAIALGLWKGHRMALVVGKLWLAVASLTCGLVAFASLGALASGEDLATWGVTVPEPSMPAGLLAILSTAALVAFCLFYRLHASGWVGRYFALRKLDVASAGPPREFPFTRRKIPSGWWS